MSEDVFDPSGPSGGGRQQQKRGCLGMSFMILGIVTAVFFVLCCGVGVWIANSFRMSITQDSDEIAEVREKIAAIDIPAEMQPAFGMDFGLFGFGMQMVAYGNEIEVRQMEGEEQGSFKGVFLVLIQLKAAGQEAEFENQMRRQSGDMGPDIRVESSETRTVMIDGKETEVEFAQGTNTEDNTQVRSVRGTFSGRGGPGIFWLVVPEENWNEEGWNDERAIQLLESIHK